MNIKVKKVIDDTLLNNNINIIIEANKSNTKIEEFVNYIEAFEKNKIIVMNENKLKTILISDVLYFYSENKFNYCKTKDGKFKIRSKLYELEKINLNFLRISKSCIINVQNVECFDLGETGKIIVRFYDDTEKIVARRKIKDVLHYLEERGI